MTSTAYVAQVWNLYAGVMIQGMQQDMQVVADMSKVAQKWRAHWQMPSVSMVLAPLGCVVIV